MSLEFRVLVIVLWQLRLIGAFRGLSIRLLTVKLWRIPGPMSMGGSKGLFLH